jgi:hypothetical protein
MFRLSRVERLPKARRATLRVERMEERALLSALSISPISVPPPPGTMPPVIVHPPLPPTLPPVHLPPGHHN